MHDFGPDKRNVIPRWRPLVAIEKSDLSSLGRFESETHSNTSSDFSEQLKIWLKEGDAAAVSDIFDAYLLTRDRTLLSQFNSILNKTKQAISPRLKATLEIVGSKQPEPLEIRRRIAFLETDYRYVNKSISILKRRIIEYPRDSLSYLELARLYAINGQYDSSEKSLAKARILAPENRVILRATIQFYNIISNLEDGLSIIRKSDRLKYDPWIQSAEIATSNLLGKESRIASRKLLNSLRDGEVGRDRSELAMAMATLERDSGLAERRVFQVVSKALPNSTENGFAQAIWLSDHSSKGFVRRFPDAKPSVEAYEARVKLAFSERDFELAAGFAELWVEDQPFSAEAVVHLLNLRSVHLEPDKAALEIAKKALHVFQDNWHVLNACALVFGECGRIDDANLTIERLKKITPSGSSQAFVQAAEGFNAFAAGDFSYGRKSYESAIKTGREFRNRHIVVDATMFWMRCEIDNNLIAPEYGESLSKLIENALRKLPQVERDYLETVWHSIKLRIQKRLVHEVVSSDELGPKLVILAKEHLEEGELFTTKLS